MDKPQDEPQSGTATVTKWRCQPIKITLQDIKELKEMPPFTPFCIKS